MPTATARPAALRADFTNPAALRHRADRRDRDAAEWTERAVNREPGTAGHDLCVTTARVLALRAACAVLVERWLTGGGAEDADGLDLVAELTDVLVRPHLAG